MSIHYYEYSSTCFSLFNSCLPYASSALAPRELKLKITYNSFRDVPTNQISLRNLFRSSAIVMRGFVFFLRGFKGITKSPDHRQNSSLKLEHMLSALQRINGNSTAKKNVIQKSRLDKQRFVSRSRVEPDDHVYYVLVIGDSGILIPISSFGVFI